MNQDEVEEKQNAVKEIVVKILSEVPAGKVCRFMDEVCDSVIGSDDKAYQHSKDLLEQFYDELKKRYPEDMERLYEKAEDEDKS